MPHRVHRNTGAPLGPGWVLYRRRETPRSRLGDKPLYLDDRTGTAPRQVHWSQLRQVLPRVSPGTWVAAITGPCTARPAVVCPLAPGQRASDRPPPRCRQHDTPTLTSSAPFTLLPPPTAAALCKGSAWALLGLILGGGAPHAAAARARSLSVERPTIASLTGYFARNAGDSRRFDPWNRGTKSLNRSIHDVSRRFTTFHR